MAVSKISENTRNKIIKKSVNPLPNSPSRVGYSASDIKGAMFKFVTDEENSVISEINRIVDEMNDKALDFEWLTYDTTDWTAVSNYYTLTIPFSTHKCLNAYVEEMMLKVGDDYENVLRPTYKRLANDNILIRSDSPVEFKILIKGER